MEIIRKINKIRQNHDYPKTVAENYHVFVTPVYSTGELPMQTFLSNPFL